MIVFDIETVPNSRVEEYLNLFEVKPKANLKDPEKIAEDIKLKKDKLLEKSALQWWTGKVVCISAYNTDTEVMESWCSEDEKKILCSFFNYLVDNYQHECFGQYIFMFDIPFIKGRSLVHDLGIPNQFYNSKIQDIQDYFSRSSQCEQRCSLSTIAWALQIKPKTMRGGDVGSVYTLAQLTGDLSPIKDYCVHDVEITVEVYKRIFKEYKKVNV